MNKFAWDEDDIATGGVTYTPPPPLAAGAAWIDGRIVPIAEAKIPVTDWGFTHADTVYDVAPVWDGAFVGLDRYLTRFEASVAEARLDPGVRRPDLRRILHAIVAASGLRAAYVAFVCTRGQPRVPGVRDPRACENRFFAWCVPYVFVIPRETAERGVRLHVPQDIHRIPDESVNPKAKNYHWGDFTRGLFAALDAGFDTVALRDRDGLLTEGPGFNVFIVKDGKVITPARTVLDGNTRGVTLELAAAAGLPTEVRAVPMAEALEADEVFLTSSGGGPAGVVEIDGRTFSNGAPGPVTTLLRAAYWDWLERGPEREPVAYG